MERVWNGSNFINLTVNTYRMLINICRFVVRGLLLTNEPGTYRLATWLQDEEMHRLYERFVLSYYQKHHPGYAPRAAYIDWDVSDDSDILCRWRQDHRSSAHSL